METLTPRLVKVPFTTSNFGKEKDVIPVLAGIVILPATNFNSGKLNVVILFPVIVKVTAPDKK